ncbi:MAG: DUF1992 domain-containing protein [Nocardioidaceae bacterium]
MSDDERRLEDEHRLRQAALTAATGQPHEPDDADDDEPEGGTPAQRIEQQTLWVDMQIRQAMARGDFDNLPGAGKPIRGLGGTHDPDWWVKSLVEREQITGALPPALALRHEDAGLDGLLDREASEDGVRRTVEDFNRRVVDARRQLLGGPPVVTPTRDVDQEVVAWRARREERRRRQREQLEQQRAGTGEPHATRPATRPRLWRRRKRSHPTQTPDP